MCLIAAVSRRQVGTLPEDGAGRRRLSEGETAAVPLAVPPSGNAHDIHVIMQRQLLRLGQVAPCTPFIWAAHSVDTGSLISFFM